jgi:cellulose synthase/poly-beta-1,6-N-acetylglucosamine synthase-like glycosyltransferase
MDFWRLIYHIDIILFIFVAATVLYLAVFALASLLNKHTDVPKAKKQNRFIILIPVYKNGIGAEHTVRAALGQTYPQRLFDITVISDHIDEISNFRMAQQPVTLLTPNFEKSSRAKSLQLAINNLPQFKIYDIVVILNAGNIVEPDFLEKMNDAYESAGTKAIQAHRLSQNRDTASARLSSTFEEINNSIFRLGHIALGLSAASAGSAMAFDFEWFKENIMTIDTIFDDKELEIRLLRQHIFIDYFDDILVFEEKYRNAEDFSRQRGRWIASQFSNITRNIHYLPVAIFTKHYNLMDKIIQWMILPRMIMMGIILLMGVVMPFIYFTLALKWWALFAIVLFIFAIATPNYLVDDKWDKTFYMLPVIFLSALFSKTIIGKRLKAYANQKL